ncbi:GDP-mannose 4,6-dehydratase [Anaeromyxobacter paludicola]|uniref:NAD-dependent dehydratase n=1 Tax=Anaeromyxobacter paludicola TaxID=2918171 RepID=A0ABM7X5J9_9BACT|nr:GDP-mannose 4,6-dehydratase [Anaeromyxobacter paludicola]BDG07081.1 NAD-dependent dehydratase [Anaeromyxobacter paludicola]
MRVQGAKVLVTGAGGFIGSHLVELLVRRGAKVRAMVHYDARADQSNLELVSPEVRGAFEVVSGNVEDPYFVASAVKGQEAVFHLAALIAIPYSYLAPASFVATNVQGTLNVLEACRTQGVSRLVHTSTSETYGTALYTPIDEQHPLQGQSPYSASKIGADKLAESYHLSFGLPVATVRPFNTYGPRQSARAVIPTIIAQALASPAIRLGSLTPVRDLNYVLDTVAGFVAVAESDAAVGQVVNVGSGSAVTIGELAALILRIMGIEKEIVVDQARVRPEKSEVMALLADRRKAEALTGWTPRYTLEQGLRETVEFVRAHLDRFKPDVYNR